LLASLAAWWLRERQPAEVQAAVLLKIGRVWKEPLEDPYVTEAVLNSWVIIEIGLSNQKSQNEDSQPPGFISTVSSFFRTRAWTKSRLIVFALIAFSLVAADSLSGSVRFEKRLADPRNAFGRLATWKAAIEITAESPIVGVGLSNYSNSFDSKYNWAGEEQTSVLDARSSNNPHSNPLWILAELGLIGFVLYITANVQLFLMGYRAYKRAITNEQRIAAVSFIALAIAYWIPGLTLSSGYYSDLNLYFFFMLGILSNKSLAASD
jgi:O-antigen ligase